MVRGSAAALAGLAIALFGAAAGRHSARLPAKDEAAREAMRAGQRPSTTKALATAAALTCLGAFAGPFAAGIVGGRGAAFAAAAGYGLFEVVASLRASVAFVPPPWAWGGFAAALVAGVLGAWSISAGLAAQARTEEAA